MIVYIYTGNAAFQDDRYGEVARVLRDLADKVEKERQLYHTIKDINGNTIGHSKP